ncbi:MAG: DUF2905 domain-containing protein [Candidatus Omnitrophica bacterium]|nr:DUF2905 domain-containing protein [Candidatus Omnitrophota bacterium]MBU4589962.1 DUF2905 domain-containing protein [Candidatus Omnitrophota bacterium]
MGRVLILFGVILIITGLLCTFGANIPCIGKLQGDICIKKGNFTFYFPLATSIIISIILSLIIIFIGRRQ